jgi:acyl-CoA reductase-like NAD-dependent aldehyde dehydrogenase
LVYSQAAPSLKKVVLELGGKSANIITADAELERVIPTVMFAMATHAGQGCSLLTRTLVHRSRLDELVRRWTRSGWGTRLTPTSPWGR